MTILFRTVIEVLGKPQEHVENTLKEYIKNIKASKKYTIKQEDFNQPQKQEKQELWAAFVELEIETETVGDIFNFCFDFMPSVIEIIEPQELIIGDVELGTYLNDLQTRLHQVDMVAKQLKAENDLQKRNVSLLLRNFVSMLLTKNNLDLPTLGKLTGVSEQELGDFLDYLIDQKIVDLKDGIYYLLKQKEA